MRKQMLMMVMMAAALLAGGAFADAEDAAVNRLFNTFNSESVLINKDAAEQQKIKSLTRLNEAVRTRLIAEVAKSLDADGRLPSYGSGDITVYEFSDYQCGYCRRVFSFLDAAAERGEVQIKVVELPVLGPASEELAKLALTAWQQNNYAHYHRLLMRAPPPNDADIAKLRAGLQDGDTKTIEAILKRNFQVADLLGVRGTPAFIINNRYISGALNEEQFLRLIRAGQ